MQKKNILILDCGTKSHHVGGSLNHWFADAAMEELQNMGHSVAITLITDPYEVPEEVDKIKKADAIILQTPVWWMSPPWTFKKYEDEVFLEYEGNSHDEEVSFDPDDNQSESSSQESKPAKQYLISTTWAASTEDFTKAGEVFDEKYVDALFLPVHKAFEFLGMTALPSFTVLNAQKNPNSEQELERWKAHLRKVFG